MYTFINLCVYYSEYNGSPFVAGLDKIRLALGQSKANGRLEIKYNGKWGTVCSEQWTSQNSKAVCRMLGYQ